MKRVLLRQNSKRDIILWLDSGVLLCSVISCCNLPHIMFREGSPGTDARRALTSYKDMLSPVAIGCILPVLHSAGYF